VLPATVMIEVGRGTGSGFLIDREGRIVTNNHVVAGAADGSRIRVVYSDGRRVNAVLVGRSPSYDIAVIKASGAGSVQPIEPR
jgi:putative serine protease PepD